MLDIPTLIPITIPSGETIDYIKRHFSTSDMTDLCQKHLTNANYGTDLPPGPIQGGFLPVATVKDYQLEEACLAVQELARQTRRNLRFGTPFELLLRKTQGLVCDWTFVSLAKMWDDRVLHWADWGFGGRFSLTNYRPGFRARCKVFIVEDL